MSALEKTTTEQWTIEKVKVSEIRYDPRVQRPLNENRVKTMARNFDESAVGLITVSEREDGGYYCVDGWGRTNALLAVGLDDERDVLVYHGLSLAREAQLFLWLNNKSNVTAYEKYCVGLTAGETEALRIDHIVREAGLRVSNSVGDGLVVAVVALRQAYRLDSGLSLSKALHMSQSAWGAQPNSREAAIIMGLAFVFKTYQDIDTEALRGKLSKYPGGPSGLFGQARAMKAWDSSPMWKLVAKSIVNVYNSGRRKGALEVV